MNRLLSVGFVVLGALSAGAATVWMSPDGDDRADGSEKHPLKTLEAAVEKLRDVERDEPKEIVVKDGFYPFDKEVKLDSCECDLTIRAEHPGKAVFSGGVKLDGWVKDEDDDRFLTAELPFKPQPGAPMMLLSGGKWSEIATFPAHGRIGIVGDKSDQRAITFDPKSVPGGVDITDFDFSSGWLVVPQEYCTTACYVKEADAETCTFTLANATAMSFRQFNQGFYLRNVRFGLVQPGQWMFDLKTQRIIYYPREGETPENLDVTLSRLTTIVRLRNCHNVKLDGLVFECCSQCDNIKRVENNAAVSGGISDHTTLDRCEIRNTAGKGAIFIKGHCVTVRRSHIHHTGLECLEFFDGGEFNTVEDCEIDHGGMMNPSFLLGMYSDSRVVRNKIHDGPSNGVNMWSCRSIVASNEIYRVMWNSKDGGGVYGGFMFCEFFDNHVHDIGGWAGLYADEGSRFVKYYNNRFENCFWPIHMHCSQAITVSNNTFRYDGAMRFSFQGSGHNVFCDNKIYTTAKITDDQYRSACDFWGRNEVFVKQKDGSYKSEGLVTLERRKVAPGVKEATDISEQKYLPFDAKGKVDLELFNNAAMFTQVGADGYPNEGVPHTRVMTSFDSNYLYVSFDHVWNACCGYPGWQNFTSTGWGHCDACRVDFEGGKWVICYPNGKFETSKHFKSGKVKMQKDDVKGIGGANCVMRIPLELLDIKGAKAGLAKLDLDVEEDAVEDMLTEEAAAAERGPDRKLPPPKKVLGCEIKFNATVWNEDFRESKSLFAPDGDKFATGTLKFVEPPKKKR